MTHIFPKQLTDFFNSQHNKFINRLKTLDYKLTPWVPLDKKLPNCEILIDIIKSQSKTPSLRYLESNLANGILCHTLYSYTDRKEFTKHTNNPDYLSNLEYKINPDFENHKKVIENLINFLPYKKVYLILINELLPGGYISPHRDRGNGYWGTGLNEKITIPLYSPAGNFLKLWGVGNVPFQVGQPVRINTYEYFHAAINKSNESRFHLQIVGNPDTEEMKNITEKSFQKTL